MACSVPDVYMYVYSSSKGYCAQKAELNWESDLKDVCVVLYEVLHGATRSVVLPVGLEQCGAKHYSQVMEIHLVHLRETLHTETQTWKTSMGVCVHTDTLRINECFLQIEVVDKSL